MTPEEVREATRQYAARVMAAKVRGMDRPPLRVRRVEGRRPPEAREVDGFEDWRV